MHVHIEWRGNPSVNKRSLQLSLECKNNQREEEEYKKKKLEDLNIIFCSQYYSKDHLKKKLSRHTQL